MDNYFPIGIIISAISTIVSLRILIVNNISADNLDVYGGVIIICISTMLIWPLYLIILVGVFLGFLGKYKIDGIVEFLRSIWNGAD